MKKKGNNSLKKRQKCKNNEKTAKKDENEGQKH
jgi:hypothetical protein